MSRLNMSRASTATLTWESHNTPYHPQDNLEVAQESICPEEVPNSLREEINDDSSSKRLIVAVDFGTTYSAVSFIPLDKGESTEYLGLDRIRSIENYPGDLHEEYRDRMKSEVPTEVIYPPDRQFREREDLEFMDDDNMDALDANGNGGPSGVDDAMNQDDEMFDEAMFDADSHSFRWGYGVHEAWRYPDTHFDQTNRALSRFKLLLDNSPTTETIRNHLAPTLKTLCKKKIIKNSLYVIADYLTCLLRHAKSELRAHGFDDSYHVELVLCVPAIWSQKACRDMQTAMAIAMQRARFQGVDIQNNSIENLFIVSEPEAAAAYVLATQSEITPGDTFVLLDAGGGTVDANTYTVSQTTPLRLSREVVAPGGGLYGSSYLNEAFRKLLWEILKDETYLEQGRTTINGIVETIMINEFEYRFKRSFDYYTAKGLKRFWVNGLRDNDEKCFRNSCIYISVDKIKETFLECLKGIASVMENQIAVATQKGSRVEKVILIGGFAGSISLKKYLEKHLEGLCGKYGHKITLIRPENTATAVASGAVLRALNKEQGPQRLAQSSYGILRTEPFMEYPEHEGLSPSYDTLDGLPYIKSTVDWVLKLGAEVPPVWECRPFVCSHTFRCWPPVPLLCQEKLFVSDSSTESHYKLTDRRNQGAEEVGKIVVDFTFLRDQGLIAPIEPEINMKGRRRGKRHYRVNYTMLIRVVDRDLRCYAIYNGQVVKKCRINIASAFSPGVK